MTRKRERERKYKMIHRVEIVIHVRQDTCTVDENEGVNVVAKGTLDECFWCWEDDQRENVEQQADRSEQKRKNIQDWWPEWVGGR